MIVYNLKWEIVPFRILQSEDKAFSAIKLRPLCCSAIFFCSMGIKFQTARSIGDVLKIFSQLPEGFEPDYSHFNFSNSPNVDPAWLASRPTPPPYAELTIGSSGQEVLDMKQRFYELGALRSNT